MIDQQFAGIFMILIVPSRVLVFVIISGFLCRHQGFPIHVSCLYGMNFTNRTISLVLLSILIVTHNSNAAIHFPNLCYMITHHIRLTGLHLNNRKKGLGVRDL